MTPAVNPQLAQDWLRIRSELRRAVADSVFAMWLDPLRPHSHANDVLFVAAPAPLRAFVASRLGEVLRSCAASVLGPRTAVEIVSWDHAPPPAGSGQGSRGHAEPPATEAFNPKLTFDQFVIGDANHLAHAAALAVAENPGQAYNPLFLYGPPGVGKTHLLHSIANYLSLFGEGLTVRYATVERFTSEFVASLQSGGIDAFKARFRHNDVLLIDDVQYLQNKAKTEEEFFHTFNALYDTGSQLVLTSDRLPSDMGALARRLRERFEAGLVTEIGAPGLATRMAILRKRVHHDGIVLADDSALRVIAERITVNARTLEGALIRVVAFHSLTGRPIDGALADEVLTGLYPGAPTVPGAHGGARAAARPTIGRIQELACEAFGVTHEELVSASRAARVTWPRHVAMHLAREHTGESLPSIGRSFGGRDHSTVLHACKRVHQRLARDPDAATAVGDLAQRLTDAR